MIIAIDGPAGSGKSTTARWVAKTLGLLYLDTGAMYRAIAWAVLRDGVDPDEAGLADWLAHVRIEVHPHPETMQVLVDGKDVTSLIRTPEVSGMASKVGTIPEVRTRLVDLQREIAHEQVRQKGGVVLDGRDIGTVVFPHADLKIFLDADARTRAERRVNELVARGVSSDFDSVLAEIEARDWQDRNRKHAPLRQAEDAHVLDTSHRTIADQVHVVVNLATQILQKNQARQIQV